MENEAALDDFDNTVSGNTVSGNTVSEDTVSGNDFNFELIYVTDEDEYKIYRAQLKAQLCNQQLECLTSFYTAKSEQYDIAKIKYELGYVTETEVKEAEMQFKAVELQMDTVQEQLDYYTECIRLRGGELEDNLLAGDLSQLTKDYATFFMEQSTQLKSYDQQIEFYEQYLNSTDLEEKDKQAVKAQLAMLQASKQSYEIELKEYVMQLQLQYDTILRELQQYDNEIEIMLLKIQNQKLLYEVGKTAKSTLTGMEAELQQLRYGRSSKICDGQLILYILEHAITNQTV